MDVYSRLDASRTAANALYEDNVLPWYREVVGSMPGRINQRLAKPVWFIWEVTGIGSAQRTHNGSPQTSLGQWVEVGVPYWI
jgi:hypothetical protein